MRSVYLPLIDIIDLQKTIILNDKAQVHHLANVARIALSEQLLILNGLGDKILCQVSSIEKKAITLSVISCKKEQTLTNIDLLLSIPKKTALEDVVRQTTELGINTILLLKSAFAQSYEINQERFDKIIESAIILSNNPFHMKIELAIIPFDEKNLEKLFSEYKKIFYFTSQDLDHNQSEKTVIKKNERALLIIGPEGGFSHNEESFFAQNSKVTKLHLKSYILKTETAVVAAIGFLLAQIE